MDEFVALRKRVGARESDREFCVGDILNKGPKSIELLRFIRNSSIRVTKGNHEDKFIRYYLHERERQKTGRKNPMKLDDKEKEIFEALNSEDIRYLLSLPVYRRIGALTILHAGVLPDTRLDKLTKKEAAKVMRVRYLTYKGEFVSLDDVDMAQHFWWSDLYDGRYGYIVYGHQPFLKPRVDRWSFGIDTGGVYGNVLTAVIFKEGQPWEYGFVSEDCRPYAKMERAWILPNL